MVIICFYKSKLEEFSDSHKEKWKRWLEQAKEGDVELFYAGQEECGFVTLKNGLSILG
jgi:hypothetical protein